LTKLLDEAIQNLRQLADQLQDRAARALIMQIEEEPGDIDATKEGDVNLSAATT
jgi:hypothetical protein